TGRFVTGAAVQSNAGLVGSIVLNEKNCQVVPLPPPVVNPMTGPVAVGVRVAAAPAKVVLFEKTFECPVPCPALARPAVAMPFQQGAVPMQISVAGRQIRIKTSSMEVCCDRMTCLGPNDRVLLEGNVCVTFFMPDRPATIQAERMVVSFADGSYAVNPAARPV